MIYTELNCFGTEMTEKEVLEKAFYGAGKKISGVFVAPLMVPAIKEILPKHVDLKIATFVDYPYGMADTSTRNHGVLQAIKKGANIIDLVCSLHYLNNKDGTKFSKDVLSNLEICKKNNADLRMVLEYKLYDTDLIYKICHIIADLGVEYVVPSTDRILDDIIDNVLICNRISKQTGLKTIVNAPIHKEQQIKAINESGTYGVRFKSEKSFNLFTSSGV